MKVNTFKKIEEGFFSDLASVGSDVVDVAKSSSEYQKKQQERFKNKVNIETQKRYLQDFIEDLIVDLDAAIKGGQVSTVVSIEPSSGTLAPEPAAQPQQAVQPTNATRQAALQRSAQRSAQRKEPQQSEKPIDREEELAGVADLGYNESYNYSSFLNTLVESYISEQATESISQWIMRWFAAYMNGVEWESNKSNVEAIAKEVESSYSKDRGKAAISKLANSSWNLIKDVGTTPYGAKDVISTNTPPSNDSKLSDKELAKRIKDDTEKLKKTDPNLYNKIKNSLPESKIIKKKTP